MEFLEHDNLRLFWLGELVFLRALRCLIYLGVSLSTAEDVASKGNDLVD